MEHIYFFYFLITLLIGLMSLGTAATVYIKIKQRPLKYYLYFYSAFTLLAVLSVCVLYLYLHTDLPDTHPRLLDSLKYFTLFIVKYILMFTIPVLAHGSFAVPHTTRKNLLFGMLTIITFGADHLSTFMVHDAAVERVGDYLVNSIFIAVIVYSLLIGFHYRKQLQDPLRIRLSKNFLLMTGIFLPGIVVDLFWLSPIPFFPMLYCGFSIMVTYHLVKHSQHYLLLNIADGSPNEKFAEEVFRKYQISPREQEIVSLLLQGSNNQKIAETLFISVSTVKFHLSNIYAKFGVKSRYEVLTFFRNAERDRSMN